MLFTLFMLFMLFAALMHVITGRAEQIRGRGMAPPRKPAKWGYQFFEWSGGKRTVARDVQELSAHLDRLLHARPPPGHPDAALPFVPATFKPDPNAEGRRAGDVRLGRILYPSTGEELRFCCSRLHKGNILVGKGKWTVRDNARAGNDKKLVGGSAAAPPD